MVIEEIKKALKERKKRRERENREEEKLQSFRETEEIRKAEAIKKEADRLVQLKQYKTAIEEYSKVLEIYPYNENNENLFRNASDFLFKTFFNTADCYSCLNRFDEAIRHFDKALKINTEDSDNKIKALMGKGNSYYRLKMFIDSVYTGGVYRILTDTGWDKENEEMLAKFKKIDEKQNLIELAHNCFHQVTEIDRNFADAWYNKGHMETKLGRIKEAMLSFDNVVNISKGYENKEGIALFDEIKKEKGIEVEQPKALDEQPKAPDEPLFKPKTGHMVRSKSEKLIADFLFDSNLMFQYNLAVSWADEDNFKAAFYIPQLDLYLEHFKHNDIKDYENLMKWKISQYEKNKKKMIYTVFEDERNIEEALQLKLKPYIML